MSTAPLISVIMPVYNAAAYVAEAIGSVLAQEYPHFELLIIDDGSTDGSAEIVRRVQDARVSVYQQPNGGVSEARNRGLLTMKGDFFCFMDADDLMPPKSLSGRLERFIDRPEIDVVDGRVEYIDESGRLLQYQPYQPAFDGNPLVPLLRMDRRCFFGNTWMIRRRDGITYQFASGLRYAEDLYFYISIACQYQLLYAFTTETVLQYRRHSNSSMTNLHLLENGYFDFLDALERNPKVPGGHLPYLRRRILRIMTLSYLAQGQVGQAFKIILRWIRR